MKLHLLIDSNKRVESQTEDIALVSSYREKIPVDGIIVYLDVNIVNESPEIGEVIRHQLGLYDDYYMNIANEAYVRFYRPIYMVIANVEKVLAEHKIDELVLYEGNNRPYFISEGAEGEGVRVHYKTNWMVNAFVYNYFKDKICVTWINKSGAFRLRLLNYYRSILTNVQMIASRALRGIIEQRKSIGVYTSGTPILSVVTLALQKANLDTTLKDIKNAHHIYYSYNRELVNEENVYPVTELTLKGLSKAIAFAKTRKRPRTMSLMGLPVPALQRELKYLVLKHAIYENRLKQVLEVSGLPDETIMVTNTTVGMDMVASRNVARKLGWRHINIQYVSMGSILFPDLDLADEYYLYARRTYILYKQYCDKYKLYLPLHNNKEKREKSQIVFSVFTQPIYYGKDYADFLKAVLPAIKKRNLDIEVVVKPHYRQDNMDELRDVTKDYDFVKLVGPQDSCTEILKRTTIGMSIQSSVIFEAMMAGVPTIIYNPGDKYHSTVFNNDSSYPEVNFVIEEPLQTLSILEDLENYCKKFDKRLQTFIENSGAETDVTRILKLRK